MVLQEIRKEKDHERMCKAVQQSQQGAWANWEEAVQRNLSWNDLWHMAPLRVSYIIRSVYDQLPTAANLQRWGKQESNKCGLCSKIETLDHVLSGCKVALASGIYTWRHNQVLEILAEKVEAARLKANSAKEPEKETLIFVTEGQTKSYYAGTSTAINNILQAANDWEMTTDLRGRGPYPDIIEETGMRPDIVLSSENIKQLIAIELTVPSESRMEESHELKLAKYESLRDEVATKGWKMRILPVEVGTRGFVGRSMFTLLRKLGLSGLRIKRTMKSLSECAEKASCAIWAKRQKSGAVGDI